MSNNSRLESQVIKASIAVNRFGYGAKKDELNQAMKNPKEWVKSQLISVSFDQSLPHSNDIFKKHYNYQKIKKQMRIEEPTSSQKAMKNIESQPDMAMLKKFGRTALREMSADNLKQAITSTNSVSWRLLDFFSNHFSVSTSGRLMTGLAATLEREAIAPHMLDNFESLLITVEQHPAMLIYLNNEKSFGPNSRLAKKRKVGLNENFAREILELHTLGVNNGYDQKDVIELAKGLTGWGVKKNNNKGNAGFNFRANGHEPGNRNLLGKDYPQLGVNQGKQMLKDLAMHPTTAKYICYKLAYHFVSHSPSTNLINKMVSQWLQTRGNIKKVMECLFDSEDAWQIKSNKLRTPREFIIAAHRALGVVQINEKFLYSSLRNLGQQPFNSGSPAGYSDDYKDWLGGSALMARLDWSTKVSQYKKNVDIEQLILLTFGEAISTNTYKTVMGAESRQQALTLLLMSPEFQWR